MGTNLLIYNLSNGFSGKVDLKEDDRWAGAKF